jgi:hypothetical protein
MCNLRYMKMNRKSIRNILIVAVFSIAMGYLESAVVVYLRKIYYPDGFDFPIKMMDMRIVVTEIFREFATVIMLACTGIIAGRSKLERFGLFLFSFGIWDIFYYVFLYALLDWPESIFTWDILFLIPSTWVGPVIAPVINALSMVIFGGAIWYFKSLDKLQAIKPGQWIMLVLGSLIVIRAYMADYISYLQQQFPIAEIFFPKDPEKLTEFSLQYVPVEFNWWIFWIGQILICAGIGFWVVSHRGSRRISKGVQRGSA